VKRSEKINLQGTVEALTASATRLRPVNDPPRIISGNYSTSVDAPTLTLRFDPQTVPVG
jgi:hypothetical protein